MEEWLEFYIYSLKFLLEIGNSVTQNKGWGVLFLTKIIYHVTLFMEKEKKNIMLHYLGRYIKKN